MKKVTLEMLKKEIIGIDAVFSTPYGDRNIFYADYTASGKGLRFLDRHLEKIQAYYANTHTEDDFTGKTMTSLLHDAEHKIKEFVNAGDKGKIICVGSGATGALKKLQEIVGIYIPPVTKEIIYNSIEELNCDACTILGRMNNHRPVIFVGPYEHHTNELMWREAFAEVVVIGLNENGEIDKKQLEEKLKLDEYKNRRKLASFSAGSNITGLKTNIYEIAEVCHENDCLIFYDFAAIAPYVEIDMNRDEKSYFDAIFFSPHKFIGGTGTCGVLVFNEDIYRKDLPPTAAGGGTVDYVGLIGHDFSTDIETREKAGTPPIMQVIKTALVMEIKEKIGTEKIESIELEHCKYFMDRFENNKNITILGIKDPEKRVPIISFNIFHNGRILHPKFVTKLLNDLFGVQSRAGCSCAGPYGHVLLGIDNDTSQKYRKQIQGGNCGLKPGWVRVNLHYIFDREDIEFLCDCIEFIVENGHYFIPEYKFYMKTGEWKHKNFTEKVPEVSIYADYKLDTIDTKDLKKLRKSYIKTAKNELNRLKEVDKVKYSEDRQEIEALKFFYYID